MNHQNQRWLALLLKNVFLEIETGKTEEKPFDQMRKYQGKVSQYWKIQKDTLIRQDLPTKMFSLRRARIDDRLLEKRTS